MKVTDLPVINYRDWDVTRHDLPQMFVVTGGPDHEPDACPFLCVHGDGPEGQVMPCEDVCTHKARGNDGHLHYVCARHLATVNDRYMSLGLRFRAWRKLDPEVDW